MATLTINHPCLRLKRLDIETFCELWIPKLYGLQPDERGYKKACISELAKIVGDISPSNIQKNWKWGKGEKEYPKWVDRMLELTDARYKTIEAQCGTEYLKSWHKSISKSE